MDMESYFSKMEVIIKVNLGIMSYMAKASIIGITNIYTKDNGKAI